MKKSWILVTVLLTCLLCACGPKTKEESKIRNDENISVTDDNLGSNSNQDIMQIEINHYQSESDEDNNQEENEVDKNNMLMIAEALGVSEESTHIRFIQNALETIKAGRIQTVLISQDTGQTVLEIVAEDGVNYKMYLSGSGSVEAVKNCSTGEWPIRSYK